MKSPRRQHIQKFSIKVWTTLLLQSLLKIIKQINNLKEKKVKVITEKVREILIISEKGRKAFLHMTQEKRIKTYLHTNSKNILFDENHNQCQIKHHYTGGGQGILVTQSIYKGSLPSYTNVPINQQKKNSQKRGKMRKGYKEFTEKDLICKIFILRHFLVVYWY